MGYEPRATITYGYTIPSDYDAEWLEDDAPEETVTALIQNLVPTTEIGVVQAPDGTYRLIRYEEQVKGNNDAADLGSLTVTDLDREELQGIGKLLGLDFTNQEPTWHLSVEYI